MVEQNERVTKVALDIIEAVQDRLAAHDVTHQEYRTAWAWLMGLAESGEVPLFLDVFFESIVERNTFDGVAGSEHALQGPYYLEDHEVLSRPYCLPMRDDEPGEAMVFTGVVKDLAGNGIGGVTVDTWQSANDGTYSGFVPDVPRGNLRGIMTTAADGSFRFSTIKPVPYRIPHDGPTGEFLEMTGLHPWRPAHFHFTITADGYKPLTTQIYFRNDEIIDGIGDITNGVKDSLIVDIGQGSDPTVASEHGIGPSYLVAEAAFVLDNA